jgi:hypothetical protein
MKLDKIMHTGNLHKETRQADNLSDAAARALQSISAVVTEHPSDASLQEMLRSFLRALGNYDAETDKAKAAAAFGEEIHRIIRERSLALAVKSSLGKGMSPHEFWNR